MDDMLVVYVGEPLKGAEHDGRCARKTECSATLAYQIINAAALTKLHENVECVSR